LVTPPSKEWLRAKQYFLEREFFYEWKDFRLPYEDLMTHNQAIHQHLVTLYFIIKEFNLKTVLEIGTQQGYSTVAMGCAVKEIGGHLYSCDIVECPIAIERMLNRDLYSSWTFYESKSSNNISWNKPIDLLFLDSKHTEERINADLRHFEPHVRKGGFIIIHDFLVFPKMAVAIDEYFKNKKYSMYRYFNDCGLQIFRKL